MSPDAAAPSTAIDPDSGRTAGRTPGSKTLLIVAVVLAVVWWIALASLAFLTANPVTLNREQISRAQYVVTARIDDLTQGRVHVEREWKRNVLEGEIVVSNLSAAAPKVGDSYLIPLTTAGNGYRIAEAPLPKAPPLIYPATPDAISQLQAILGSPQ